MPKQYAEKIEQARHHLKQARSAYDRVDEHSLRFELSSCLAAARSPFQYAETEIKPKPHLRPAGFVSKPAAVKWFDAIGADPLYKFMKDLRDEDIHARMVKTESTKVALMPSPGHFGINPRTGVAQGEPPAGEPRQFVFSTRFNGWNGPENALMLMERYIDSVETKITEGHSQGHII